MPKERGIYVKDTKERGEPVRLLLVDGAIQTGMYLDAAKRGELYSPYLRRMNDIFEMRPGIKDTLMIGGGGFAFPRTYLAGGPDRRIDVVEKSRAMVGIARESFFLDETMEMAGMTPGECVIDGASAEAEQSGNDAADAPRLRIYVEDGADYLLRCPKRYDYIINDAFDGWQASAELRGRDIMRLIKAHLNAGGVYAVNVATAGAGLFGRRARSMRRLMSSCFRYITELPGVEGVSRYEEQNYIFFGSDADLIPDLGEDY